MKAIVVGPNGPELREITSPTCADEQVKILVRAVGLNRADVAIASGQMHGAIGGPGTVLGAECAGEVSAVGARVDNVSVGDRVMSSCAGSYAEYAVADMGRVHPIPSNMTFAQAATLPVGLQTMHNALFTAGRLGAGESVLIQGASSGVGLVALQMAKLKGASLVIGSSTNADKRVRLREFGADLAVDPRDPSWVDRILDATRGKGVDLIVDQISGYVANDNLKAAAVRGRIVNVGRLGGYCGDFNFDLHAERRIEYIGVTFRTRSVAEIREINRNMRAEMWKYVEDNKIALPVDRSFSLEQASEALSYMNANAHFGKVVLEL